MIQSLTGLKTLMDRTQYVSVSGECLEDVTETSGVPPPPKKKKQFKGA